MELSNFEDYLDDVILKRGKDYFNDGQVQQIKEVDENNYIVEVAGTDHYTVKIHLTNQDKIVNTYCDCPYDWGDFCKHEAAALFALRSDKETNKPKNKKTSTSKRSSDLKTTVSNLPKAELIRIILDISEGYP